MGAKTWMLVYASADAKQELAENSRLDREASLALARKLFPGEALTPGPDGELSLTSPPDHELHIGRFGSDWFCLRGVAGRSLVRSLSRTMA